MKKHIFIRFYFTISFICLFLSGCSKSVINTKNIDKKDLNLFDTSYTKFESNNDGTYSFYVYAAPIQFEENKKYYKKDNSIIESSNNNNVFENKASDKKTYFSKLLKDGLFIDDLDGKVNVKFLDSIDFSDGQIIDFTNIFGDTVPAVSYVDEKLEREVVAYPTISGVYVEFIYQNELNISPISIDADADAIEKKGNGYLILQKGDTKKAIFYEPIIKYEDNNELLFNAGYSYQKTDNGVDIQITHEAKENSAPVRIAFSIEKYVNKMPDTSLYSKANINSYLRSYAVLGYHELFGTGIEYLRFRVNHFLTTESGNIISAEYCVKRLDYKRNNQALSLYKKESKWQSMKAVWDKNPETGKEIIAENTSDSIGWVHFDITEFIKKCVDDTTWNTESYGGVLRCDNEYAILATSDNSLYVPYIKIVMREIPSRINVIDKINPDIE